VCRDALAPGFLIRSIASQRDTVAKPHHLASMAIVAITTEACLLDCSLKGWRNSAQGSSPCELPWVRCLNRQHTAALNCEIIRSRVVHRAAVPNQPPVAVFRITDMADEFATVLKSWSVEDAHLARIRLENEGIACHLSDDRTVGIDWGLANAIRGVSVIVKQGDADRAREILNAEPSGEEFEFPPESHGQDDSFDSTTGSEGNSASTFDDPTEEPLPESVDVTESSGQSAREIRPPQSPFDRMKSIAGPVVYLMLIPIFIWFALQITAMIMSIVRR